MSYDYGIGAALAAGMELVQLASRATGRTAHMIATLKDGDRVICLNGEQAQFVERLARKRPVKVRAFVCDPSLEGVLSKIGTDYGTTHFDHTWVDAFFKRQVDIARKELDRIAVAINKDPPRYEMYPERFERWL